MARPRWPPRLPEADVGVAGAGRRERVHAPAERGAGAVRAAARRTGAGQAALLRDGDAVCGLGRRPAGREPRRAADEDRGQPRSPVESRRDRRVRAGRDPGSLRSGSLDHDHQPRRDPAVQLVLRGIAVDPHLAAGQERRRPAHPHRNRGIADSGSPARGDPDGAARSQVGTVGAGRAPQRPRRQPTRLWRLRRRAVLARQGRCGSFARCGLHVHRCVGAAARACFCLAAPRRERTTAQPVLCG